ncbi:hypothetical protein RFI_24723 [Reticulomyxa filosa]|uniref:Uncharacterized protein n=1 Tax=Reticulomyxa filosa TaxID=46433 RepID=X6MGU7_RETFI|nr:hypothetical protein RFI_24723 [Reticulomyxa filosa]|eukprot:ETO12652.1 hypothetical protein RFI_24723 [Reticulomyxa filosa]
MKKGIKICSIKYTKEKQCVLLASRLCRLKKNFLIKKSVVSNRKEFKILVENEKDGYEIGVTVNGDMKVKEVKKVMADVMKSTLDFPLWTARGMLTDEDVSNKRKIFIFLSLKSMFYLTFKICLCKHLYKPENIKRLSNRFNDKVFCLPKTERSVFLLYCYYFH